MNWRIPLFLRVCLVYAVLGAALYVPHFVQARKHKAITQVSQSAEAKIKSDDTRTPELITGQPVRIVIANVQIDIGIIPGTLNESSGWTVSQSHANFMNISAPLNNGDGLTVIYGHDIPTIFHRIKNLQAGDKVYVYDELGRIFAYEYVSTEVVQPSDTLRLTNENKKTAELILITCDGRLSEKRALVRLKFTGVSQ
jgi:LPXTG-site transpeptidase (sortase) family protein